MQEVAQNEWGEPFAHPVSEAEAPGYLDWIRHPMDLGTIAHRLQTGHYIDCGATLIFSPIKLSSAEPETS